MIWPPHRAPRGSPLSSPACSPPRGGNCTNRDATRRRHAVAMLLMVQNPHLLGGFRGAPRGSRRAPRGGCRVPARSLGSALSGRCDGGNCTNRDATRRRHAVAMRLMVQNPHASRAGSMACSTFLPAALPTVPHGVPHSPPHRAPRGSPLSSPPCSPQPSTGGEAAPGCAPEPSIIRGISRKHVTCLGRG